MADIKKLMHITHLENAKIIMVEGFRISKHDEPIEGTHHRTNQWLGDGVYFFKDGVESAQEIGFNLVSRKRIYTEKNPFIYSKICVKLDFEELAVKDFSSIDDYAELKEFTGYLIEDEIKRKNSMEALILKKDFDILFFALENRETFKNQHGGILGTLINNFVKAYQEEIDVIAMMFYPAREEHLRTMTGPYGLIMREPIYQCCVRKVDTIPPHMLTLSLECD